MTDQILLFREGLKKWWAAKPDFPLKKHGHRTLDLASYLLFNFLGGDPSQLGSWKRVPIS